MVEMTTLKFNIEGEEFTSSIYIHDNVHDYWRIGAGVSLHVHVQVGKKQIYGIVNYLHDQAQTEERVKKKSRK